MNITISINDGQAAMPTQGVATSATASVTTLADQSAGPSRPAADTTKSPPPEYGDAEVRDAGGPSAALVQEVESALGRAGDSVEAATNGATDAGAAPA